MIIIRAEIQDFTFAYMHEYELGRPGNWEITQESNIPNTTLTCHRTT